MQLSYVLPVHNEEAVLALNVARLRAHLSNHPGAEIILVENGSRDSSWKVACDLAEQPGSVPIRAFRVSSAGIGYAFDCGLREAIATAPDPTQRWAVLTATDLPFDFTDLDAAGPLLAQDGPPSLLIGSKAHPASVVDVPYQRHLASWLYRQVRHLVAGMRTMDSQGSILIRLDMAARLVSLVKARDFFYTTELVLHLERMGERIVELPVTLAPSRRASTVRPMRDGFAMCLALVRETMRGGRVHPRRARRCAGRNMTLP
jgi:glycosyltransferase involved in cell wall biosynthesis